MGGGFDNTEFHTLWKLYVRICNTTIESCWSNGSKERNNAILDLTPTKTMEDIKCDLQLAVSCAASANSSLKKCSQFLCKRTCFAKKSEFPKRMWWSIACFRKQNNKGNCS